MRQVTASWFINPINVHKHMDMTMVDSILYIIYIYYIYIYSIYYVYIYILHIYIYIIYPYLPSIHNHSFFWVTWKSNTSKVLQLFMILKTSSVDKQSRKKQTHHSDWESIDWRYRFHIFLAYFSGLNFREYPHNIWPEIWYVHVPP